MLLLLVCLMYDAAVVAVGVLFGVGVAVLLFVVVVYGC